MGLPRNDLWSEIVCFEVLFKSYFFHHSFNKYLLRAHSELGILLCSGDTMKSKGSLFSGSLLGEGREKNRLLISQINESLIPGEDQWL